MNCEQASEQLSAYFDDELPDKLRAAVAEHLAECAACTEQLAAIENLSEAAQSSAMPVPTVDLTERVLESIERDRGAIGGRMPVARRQWALGAVLAAAAAIVGFAVWIAVEREDHDHAVMVRGFDDFLAAYSAGNPNAAGVLVSRFGGEAVDDELAARVLKRRPLAPSSLGQHQVATRYALKMPCCDCLQTVYTRGGATSLIVFEHEKEQRDWFGDRPSIRARCGQTSCCMVELPGSLAASWQANDHFVTVVGVHDVAELETLTNLLKPS